MYQNNPEQINEGFLSNIGRGSKLRNIQQLRGQRDIFRKYTTPEGFGMNYKADILNTGAQALRKNLNAARAMDQFQMDTKMYQPRYHTDVYNRMSFGGIKTAEQMALDAKQSRPIKENTMQIPIKQMLLEDFDLNQNYLSPMINNVQNYEDNVAKYNNVIHAYADTSNRGLSQSERDALMNGYNNLRPGTYDPKSIAAQFVKNDALLNNYRDIQVAQLHQEALNNNYDQGEQFRKRESELRNALMDKDANLSTANHKIDQLTQYQLTHPYSQTKLNSAYTIGALGGVGAGLYGASLYNRLKNQRR